MRVLAAFSILGILAGCASSPKAQSSTLNEDPITREQIDQTGASSIFEAVSELRRGWLPYSKGTFILLADEDRNVWDRIDADLQMSSEDPMFYEPWGIEDVVQLEWMRPTSAMGFLGISTYTPEFQGAIIIRRGSL